MTNSSNWEDIELNDDQELSNSIGSLIINFAYFNSCLDEVVSRLLKLTPEQSHALVTSLQPREKSKIINRFAKNHPSKELQDVGKDVAERCNLLIDYRNIISHGHFLANTVAKTLKVYDFGRASRLQARETELAADDIAHNAMCALRLGKDLQELGQNLVAQHS